MCDGISLWTLFGIFDKTLNQELITAELNGNGVRVFDYINAESSLIIVQRQSNLNKLYMSYFAYACKTEGKNGISRLISELLHTLDSSLRDRLFVLQNEVF